MFKKRETNGEELQRESNEQKPVTNVQKQKPAQKVDINTILKGSRLTGDIHVSYDLELSGEVEGNIHAEKNSNVAIRGICKGGIRTDEGNVIIDGELNDGDILSGGDVRITGKFNGGKIEAKGRIYLNGEFNGKLEGKEIEIGSNSRGTGEIFYRESISISKGAQIEGQINRIQDTAQEKKKPEEAKVVLELPSKKKNEKEITIH